MQSIMNTKTNSSGILTVVGALGVLGGVWLVVSPYLLGYGDALANTGEANATLMGIVCGVISIALAGFCIASQKMPAMQPYRLWAAIGLVLMGVWLMAAPYLFNYALLRNPLYNLQITGAIFVLVAGYTFQALRTAAGDSRTR